MALKSRSEEIGYNFWQSLATLAVAGNIIDERSRSLGLAGMCCGGTLDFHHHCDGIDLGCHLGSLCASFFEALHVWKALKLRTSCAQWALLACLRPSGATLSSVTRCPAMKHNSKFITVATGVLSAVWPSLGVPKLFRMMSNIS